MKKEKPHGPLKVIAGRPDRPLEIMGLKIPCYVLEDETRVLSERGLLAAIGWRGRPSKNPDGFKSPFFVAANNLKPFINKELLKASNVIPFQATTGGRIASGFNAELLPRVCSLYLKVRRAGMLNAHQVHIAERCEILLTGFAYVGIIALIDEATGYQKIRIERALAKIIEQYIAKELQPWTKRFPDEFYSQIFRLKRWDSPEGSKRPIAVARITIDVVYRRLAPGVLKELQMRNPTRLSGGRTHKHHQFLTPNIGHPKLYEHLLIVVNFMKAATSWDGFHRSLTRALPILNEQIPLPIEEE